MTEKERLKSLVVKYKALKNEIQYLDFLLVGSLQARRGECGKPACRCHASQAHRHGPYWYWTRKVKAKTVSVTLSDSQAARFEEWIRNGRELERILQEMRSVSAQAIALVTGLQHSRIAYSNAGRRRQ